ncbi:MAG: TonB-dependent receptor [Alphaproteobacteria bacterium]
MRKTKLLACTAIAAMIAVPASYAQVEDEIIVTARKKEETLKDSPLAISAFGKTELENAGFDSIIDVSKATPGLFIEPFTSDVNYTARINTTPRFRGIFLDTGSRLQQTATVFLDGVAMFGGIQAVGINELERIEITKGPQSALYGRNTFSGAINYVTKDPSEEFRADIDITAATRDEYRLGLGVEGPISESLSYRISGGMDDVAGHYDNFATAGEKLGDQSQWNINGTLFFEPTDNFRMKVRGSYREIHDGAAAISGGATGPSTHNFGGFVMDANCDAVLGSGSVQPNSNTPCAPGVVLSMVGGVPFYGRTNSMFSGTITGDDIPASEIGINTGSAIINTFRQNFTGDARYNAATNVLTNGFSYSPLEKDDFGLDLDEIRISANASLDINENITLSVLGGYSEESLGLYTELDQSPDDSFTTFAAREIDDFSIEGRLQGISFEDKLSWTVGASYINVDVKELNSTINNLFSTVVFGDGFRTLPFISGAETFGVFGSVDYNLTDKITLTVEGRYQEDTLIDENVNETVAGLSPVTLTSFVPRLTAKYEPSPSSTFYATYSRGNLPGGFNPEFAELDAAAQADVITRAPSASSTFDEEKLTNFELGWKQSLAGGRAGFNLAAFYMERSNEIYAALETAPDNRPGATNPRRTVNFNGNGATTDIYGFELDGTWAATERLTFNGSLSYIDATVASFPENGGTDRFGLVFGPNASPVGQQAPKFPPWTGSLSASYEQPISAFSGFDTWFLRGDAYYTGKYFVSNANLTEIDKAVDVNVRSGLRGDDISVELFVTNLLNEDTPSSAQSFADTSFDTRMAAGGFFNFNSIGTRFGLRDKRQFGVRAKYTFR